MDVAGVHHHHHQHHHQQELSSLESMLQVCTKAHDDKKPRPPPEDSLKCPRCDSGNTKFCYYNNYSLTQPRYFCKSCRRYWTKGGTLRNVPVGGGCRKNNKRHSSSSSATSPNSPSCSAPSKIRSGPQQHPFNFITHNSNNHLLAGLPQLPYDHYLGTNVDQLGFLGFLDNPTNLGYNVGNNNNIMNGDLGLNNLGGGGIHHDQEYQMLNPMFHDHQEACNMMGFEGNMVHEVDSGRSTIGGWINGIGATNWHGLINSPLM